MSADPNNPEVKEIEFTSEKHEAAARAYFEGKGFVFKTKSEIDADVNSRVTAAESAAASAATNKAHTDWEAAFSAVIGESKPEGTKGIDWAKEKVSALKSKIPDPNASKVEKDQYEAKIGHLTERLQAMENERNAEKENAKKDRINGAVSLAIKGLSLNAEEGEIDERRSDAEAVLRSKYTFELDENSGQIVPYKNGAPAIDKDTQEAFKIDKLAKLELKYFLAPEKQEKKAGSGESTKPKPKNTDGPFLAETEEEIYAEASARGYETGSDEQFKFIQESKKASKL